MLVTSDIDYLTTQYLSPVDRASLEKVSSGFSEVVSEVGSEHFHALSGKSTDARGSNARVHSLLGDLKATVSSYDPREVPFEISTMLDRTLTIQDARMLQKFIRARDAITVWQSIASRIGVDEDFSRTFTSIEALLKKADEFSSWMQSHRELVAQIRVLSFHWDKLSYLPSEIGMLTGLETFCLPCNQLKAIPPEIGNLTRLEALDLSKNQLTHLPPEIGRLTGLRTLWLQDNHLRSLPPEIGSLRNLLHLRLEGNLITQIPPELDEVDIIGSLGISNEEVMMQDPIPHSTPVELEANWTNIAMASCTLLVAGVVAYVFNKQLT